MLVGLRSRRHIAPFFLHRPDSAAEAVGLAAQPGASAFLGGGIDLIDRLKYGEACERLIRLDHIPDLATIRREGDVLRIGALATHEAIASSEIVQSALPDLASLWRQVANPRVRHSGTIGGNIMAGKGEYDGLPAMLALAGRAEVMGPDGVARRLPLTALADCAGLLTALLIPAGTRLFADRSLRPAIAVWLGVDHANGQVSALRVSTNCAHPAPPIVALEVEHWPPALLGRQAARLAAALAAQLPEPMTDTAATGAYRRRMAEVLIRRLLSLAGEGL